MTKKLIKVSVFSSYQIFMGKCNITHEWDSGPNYRVRDNQGKVFFFTKKYFVCFYLSEEKKKKDKEKERWKYHCKLYLYLEIQKQPKNTIFTHPYFEHTMCSSTLNVSKRNLLCVHVHLFTQILLKITEIKHLRRKCVPSEPMA